MAGPRTFRDSGKSSKRPWKSETRLVSWLLHRVASSRVAAARGADRYSRRARINACDSTRYAEIRPWKDMTYDVGRGWRTVHIFVGDEPLIVPPWFVARRSRIESPRRPNFKPLLWRETLDTTWNSFYFMIHSRFIAILVDPESRVSRYFFFYCVFLFFFFCFFVYGSGKRNSWNERFRYLVEKGPKDVGYLIGGLLYGKKLTNQLLSRLRAISDGNCCGYKVYLYVSSSYNEAFFFFFFRNYSFHGIQFV